MAIKRKNRGGRVYLEEYRSIRRGSKIVSEFVRYLGPEKPDAQKGYGPVLDRIERGPALHTGAVRLLWKLAQNLKFQETINRICNRNSRGSDPFSSTLLTVWAINRVLEPKSASKLQRWVSTTDLPEITGLPLDMFTKDAFLHSLDTICGDDTSTGEQFDRSAELNKALSDHWRKEHPLPPNVKDVLAYDLTNVLFFGVTCPIAKKGRNENHEHRPQVNVAVVVHQYDHAPLAHFVYKGNRNGCRTIRNLLAHMQEAKVQPGLLVVDRGIMGKAIVDETTGMGWNLLGGVPKGKPDVRNILLNTEIPESPVTYVKDSNTGPVYAQKVTGKLFGMDRTLAVYTNAERAMREREARNRELRRIGTELTYLSTKGARWDEAKLHQEIKSIVGEWRSFLQVRVRRGGKKPRVDWKYFDRDLKSAARMDGKYLLLCTDETMDAREIVETYFNKDFAEKVFRTLKTDVDIEPVRHRLGQRVKAYIFACMLAYRLVMALRWLLLESGVTEKTSEFMDRLLEELWEVERVEVKLGGQGKTWYLNVTEFVEEGLKKIGMKSLLSEAA
ncbi:MAG: IS1634 family transposase [Candidatus Eisenbacteria bacterium]|nr:IS1634 family transposase [Candidatus Eisenbacteria bacterium]